MNSKISLLMIVCVALILVLGCDSDDSPVSSPSDESPVPKPEEPLPVPNAPELGRIEPLMALICTDSTDPIPYAPPVGAWVG